MHIDQIKHIMHILIPALATLLISALLMVQQPYPDKSVRLIVRATPGGGQDIVARALANKRTDHFGQPMVIDNRGGSGGNVGADIARLAPPGV